MAAPEGCAASCQDDNPAPLTHVKEGVKYGL